MTDLGFVHKFIPSPDKSSPVLLLLHGTGGTEEDLLPLGRALVADAALLSPRGQVLENGMPRFFRRLAEGVFDEPDLRERTHQLSAFLASARVHYKLAERKIIAVGYSNGANIASSLMLLHPGDLAGAILLRPMVPFQPETLPDLTGTSVLLSAGQHDPIVPKSNSLALEALLKSCRASVTTNWYSGGHELGQSDLTAARQWLQLEGSPKIHS
jgi:phospholipase/carboxylesterase